MGGAQVLGSRTSGTFRLLSRRGPAADSGSARPGAKRRLLVSPAPWQRSEDVADRHQCPLARMGLRLEWPRSLSQWADAAVAPTQPRQMMPPCLGPPRPWLRSEDADQQWSRPHLPLLDRSRRPARPAASTRFRFLQYTVPPRPLPWARRLEYRFRTLMPLFSWHFSRLRLRKATPFGVCGVTISTDETTRCSSDPCKRRVFVEGRIGQRRERRHRQRHHNVDLVRLPC